MPTKVLHLRLEAEIIVGCMDASGIDIPTSAVRQCLEHMIKEWKKANAIPERTPDDIMYILNGHEEKLEMPEIPPPGFKEDYDSRFANIAAQAVEFMAKEGEPDVEEEITIMTAVAEVDQIGTNLMDVDRRNIKYLSEEAPKDRFIEQAMESPDEEIFIAAVEIAYSNLPVDQWGTETAEKLISQLVKKHLTS